MNHFLDTKNKRILSELDINARQSNKQLGKKVGLSKDTVGYRIRKLEQQGIIKGYRAVIDFPKLGFTMYRVLFKLMNVNKTVLTELNTFFKQNTQIWGAGILDGEWDFSFLYYSRSNKEFFDFLEHLKSRWRFIIKEQLVSPMIRYDELERGYLLDKKKNSKDILTFDEKRETIDELDYHLLKALTKNARSRLIDLAKELQISNMLVYQRIKKLEQKKIIMGYKAYIDILLLGRDYYGIKVNLFNYSEKEKIISHIQSLPEVSAILYTIGGYDIEFDVEVLNTKEYYKLINSLRDKFPTILEIKKMGTIDYYLLNHFPTMSFEPKVSD